MQQSAISKLRARLRQPHILRQLAKYFITGGSTVAADYGTFALLYSVVSAPLFVATTGSLVAGLTVSFTLNRIWVFGARKERAHKAAPIQMALYITLFLFNTGFTYLFIKLLTDNGLNAYAAKFLSILIIMVWNFVIYKKIIFRLR